LLPAFLLKYQLPVLRCSSNIKMYGMLIQRGNIMELIGKALTLSDLVAYQEGSVVSKTLIDKKIGTLTMFSFGAGQGLSEHTAPFDAVVQVVDGEAEVTINGEPQTVTAGQLIIMPANIPHELKAVKPFKMLLTMIRA